MSSKSFANYLSKSINGSKIGRPYVLYLSTSGLNFRITSKIVRIYFINYYNSCAEYNLFCHKNINDMEILANHVKDSRRDIKRRDIKLNCFAFFLSRIMKIRHATI